MQKPLFFLKHNHSVFWYTTQNVNKTPKQFTEPTVNFIFTRSSVIMNLQYQQHHLEQKREILYEFQREFHKPSPTDKLVRGLSSK